MTPSFLHYTLLLLSFFTSTMADQNLNNDAVSLLAFKSKADPANNLPYSLHNSSAVCNWPGVQCRTTGEVGRLVLENMNLTGAFPANTLTQMDQLRVLSLRNNSLTGPVPDLAGLVNLKALFLDHNHFSGGVPPSISTLHRLRTLDLSYNRFSGGIPFGLCSLDRLNYLRLDSNRFNGSVPPFNQSSLQIFNVSVNFLTGPVPATAVLARFGPPLFSINRVCGKIVRVECGSGGPFFGKNSTEKQKQSSSPPSTAATGQSGELEKETKGFHRKEKRIGLIVGVSGGLLAVAASVLCIIMAVKVSEKRRRKGIVSTSDMLEMAEAADAAAEVMRMEEANELEKKVKRLHQGIAMKKSGNLVFYSGEARLYTAEQLMRASAELLGSGSVGTTYKAVLDNRVVLCVKRLDAGKLAGTTGEAFERHMEVVGRLRHPNVVALGAYFQTKEEKLLVYDYQPNGSLFSLIHGSKSTRAKPLHWTSCLKIAEDVAQGVSYLHQACTLVHGNLKSSNVLLGSDFEACLSDYCLYPLLHHHPDVRNGDGDSTALKAPETHNAEEPTAESDVYSFGVLLIELLTGKAASEQPDLAADDLVKWVKSSRDSGGGGFAEKPLEMMTEVAIACKARSPELRPNMRQVIKMLQEIKEAAVMADCGIGTP